MSRLLGIPSDRMAVVPLGINLAGYERGRGRRRRLSRRLFRADCAREGAARPRRCLHPLPTTDRRVARPARSRRVPGARTRAISRGGQAQPRPRRSRRRIHVPRRRRPRGQAGIPALDRRPLGARHLRRAEGRLSVRSHGERRSRRATAARRLYRSRRENRRRPARRTRRSRGVGRRYLPAVGRSPIAADTWRPRIRGRAGALRHRPIRRPDDGRVPTRSHNGSASCPRTLRGPS